MTLRVGPVGFRIGSDWRAPIAAVADLYQDYPCAEFADYTVRLEAEHVWRRWIRPSIRISGDYRLPEAAPLPLWQGLLAAELGMNLQMALGHRRHLLLELAPTLGVDFLQAVGPLLFDVFLNGAGPLIAELVLLLAHLELGALQVALVLLGVWFSKEHFDAGFDLLVSAHGF